MYAYMHVYNEAAASDNDLSLCAYVGCMCIPLKAAKKDRATAEERQAAALAEVDAHRAQGIQHTA